MSGLIYSVKTSLFSGSVFNCWVS